MIRDKKARFDRHFFELLVLIAYRHDEISIGRAMEVLGWSNTRLVVEMIRRVGSKDTVCPKCVQLKSLLNDIGCACSANCDKFPELKNILNMIPIDL